MTTLSEYRIRQAIGMQVPAHLRQAVTAAMVVRKLDEIRRTVTLEARVRAKMAKGRSDGDQTRTDA